MSKEQTIDALGYDKFIGTEVFEDGDKNYTSLNLHSLGGASFFGLETACEMLCEAVKKGETVLLTQSPGSVGPQTRNTEHLELVVQQIVEKCGIPSEDVEITSNAKGPQYVIEGRTYIPLNDKEFKALQRMYEAKKEMKTFPNPFLHQPTKYGG